MNCEELNELLAAYAVDALDGAEERAVRDHIATCRKHDEALAELQSVVSSLPAAAEQQAPAAHLRSRLLRAFDIEAAAQRSEPQRERARILPFVRRPAFAWLSAAALFLAIAGLTTWNIVLQTSSDDEGWTVSASLTGAGVDGHFWYMPEKQMAVVMMDQMPALESGRAFQAWAVYDGNAVSLGVMPHESMVAMHANLAGANMFAITEEPVNGSQQPTSPILATAKLN